jgi:hypothetical protein
LVDDIIGTRLICLTLSDVNNAIDVLRQLPHYDPNSAEQLPLYLVPDSERDYISKSKDTGYRAHHMNLVINVQHYAQFVPVQFEVQIRTLLQDSWGELTHEDTYKQGAPIPELISSMSRVMADMLTVIDGLADQIAGEIARIEELQDSSEASPVSPEEQASGPLFDAVAAQLEAQWRSLEAPISLAALADSVRREFGQEVGSDWLGLGFKQLVHTALPDARFNTAPPGYLLPPSATDSSVASLPAANPGASREGVPPVVAAIRTTDASYPAVRSDLLDALFTSLSIALSSVPIEGEPDLRWLNSVTRAARDQSSADGNPLGRNLFNYLAHMLRYTGALEGRTRSSAGGIEFSPGELRRRFFTQTLELAGMDVDAPADSFGEILEWIGLDKAPDPGASS